MSVSKWQYIIPQHMSSGCVCTLGLAGTMRPMQEPLFRALRDPADRIPRPGPRGIEQEV